MSHVGRGWVRRPRLHDLVSKRHRATESLSFESSVIPISHPHRLPPVDAPPALRAQRRKVVREASERNVHVVVSDTDVQRPRPELQCDTQPLDDLAPAAGRALDRLEANHVAVRGILVGDALFAVASARSSCKQVTEDHRTAAKQLTKASVHRLPREIALAILRRHRQQAKRDQRFFATITSRGDHLSCCWPKAIVAVRMRLPALGDQPIVPCPVRSRVEVGRTGKLELGRVARCALHC